MLGNLFFIVTFSLIASVVNAADTDVDTSLIDWNANGFQVHGDKVNGFKASLIAGSGWSQTTDGSVRTFSKTTTTNEEVEDQKYIFKWTSDQPSQYGYSDTVKTNGVTTNRFFALSDANTYY